jgi:copper resistance protein D
MSSLYFVNITVHVLAAMLWLGGMFFLGAVGAPVLRRIEPPELRARLFRALGEQFRGVGWAAITILIVTGLLNLHFRGMLNVEVLGDARFWGTGYGQALAWKIAAVVVMVGISALHDFVFGPRAGRIAPGTPAALRARRQSIWLARVNAIVGIVLVVAAVRLARGG